MWKEGKLEWIAMCFLEMRVGSEFLTLNCLGSDARERAMRRNFRESTGREVAVVWACDAKRIAHCGKEVLGMEVQCRGEEEGLR